jgi:hypothetical protein
MMAMGIVTPMAIFAPEERVGVETDVPFACVGAYKGPVVPVSAPLPDINFRRKGRSEA